MSIQYPLSTEKAIRLLESENRLVFVVDKSMRKHQIAELVEKQFSTKVTSVNVLITSKGEKRAYVRFEEPGVAMDLATKLGLM